MPRPIEQQLATQVWMLGLFEARLERVELTAAERAETETGLASVKARIAALEEQQKTEATQ